MGNIIAAAIAIIGLVVGILIVGMTFSAPLDIRFFVFGGGVLVIVASIGVPLFVLDRLDG